MGTFGTGPFSSDGALDLLDELAQGSSEDRHNALQQVFAQVLTCPDLLWRDFFPDEVVAAAAIVAATLPGGEHFRKLLATTEHDPQGVLLPTSAPDLAAAAAQALLFVAGPGGPWHQGWTDDASRAEAQHTTDSLVTILRSADL